MPGPITVGVDVSEELSTTVNASEVERAVAEAIRQVAKENPVRVAGFGERSLEVSVRITGDGEMQVLNREYRGVDRPTDVLSFAFAETGVGITPPDVPLVLGEVIVDWQYAERQAKELGHSRDTELAWLLIHGTLQLLGYHHATDEEAEPMERLENQTLRALGFRR